MQLTVQALVFGEDIQYASSLRFPIHVHGHFGVKGAVILVELLAVHHLAAVLAELHAVRLVDAGHVRARDIVYRTVGKDDIGAGSGSIHVFHSGLRICGAALIDVVEDHSGRHRAGDVHAVQDQRHHGIGVLLRILPQVHSHLPGGQRAAEDVGARLGDVDYRMGIRLRLAVRVLFRALAVSDPLSFQIEYDVVGNINRVCVIRGCFFPIHRDAVIGQLDRDCALGQRCLFR